MDIFRKISTVSALCLILSILSLPFAYGDGYEEEEEFIRDTAQREYRRQESDPNLSALQQAFMVSSGATTFTFSHNNSASQALRKVCEQEYDRFANNLNIGFSGGQGQTQELIRVVSQDLKSCVEQYSLSSGYSALSLSIDKKAYIKRAKEVFKEHFYSNVSYPANVINLNSWLEDYAAFERTCDMVVSQREGSQQGIRFLIGKLEALHQNHCPTLLSNLKQGLERQNGTLQEFFVVAGGECEARQRQCVGELRKMAGLNKQQRQTASFNELPESEKSLFEICYEGLNESQTCCAGSKACPSINKGEIQARYQSSLSNGAQRHGARLCQAQNLTEMTNDYMALIEKTCVDSVNKCSETCDEKLTEFKDEFLNCFFAPKFATEATTHLTHCKSEVAQILKAYNDRVRPGHQLLTFASKSEDIQDCRAPLTVFEQRQNSASYQASMGQEMTGVCQEYAQANPSLFKAPATQSPQNNRGIASAGTSSTGSTATFNRMRNNGESLSSQQQAETVAKPTSRSTRAGAFSEGVTAGVTGRQNSAASRSASGQQDLGSKRSTRKAEVRRTPEEWREYLVRLRKEEGFDPIKTREEARNSWMKKKAHDCLGICNDDLYGEDALLKPEVMAAAKIPFYDEEDSNYRGSYFDGGEPWWNVKSRMDRYRRRDGLRAKDREAREKDRARAKELGNYEDWAVSPQGPPTLKGVLSAGQSHARLALRRYELMAITCLDLLENSGAGFGCHKEWPPEKERAHYHQMLRDIRDHQDPFYSLRGLGHDLIWEENMFREGNNLVKGEPPYWATEEILEQAGFNQAPEKTK